MVKGEWSFTHFQDHLSFVAIADAAGAASGNTTAEVPEADAGFAAASASFEGIRASLSASALFGSLAEGLMSSESGGS